MIGKQGQGCRHHPHAAASTSRTSSRPQASRAASARATARSAIRSATGRRSPGDGQAGRPGRRRARPRGRRHARGAGADPGRGARAAQHRAARATRRSSPQKDQVHRHPHAPAPSRSATSSAPSSRRCKRQIAIGHVRPGEPGHHPDPRGQALPLAASCRTDAGDQRRHHLHDGRVRLDGRRAEGDRPHRELLARYVAAPPVQGPRDRATSSTTRWRARWTGRPSSTPASPAAR